MQKQSVTVLRRRQNILKDYKLLRIWEVIYPIGIYFVVTNVVMFVLNLVHTMTNENYMIYQIIATVIAFPFIYAFYRKEDGGKMANLPRTILFAAAAGLFGVVLNNLIGYTGLKETSQSYQEVSAAFYGSTLALEILGTCIIIPFLEELLYRGIVYQRLKAFLGVKTAIVLSAVIFGAMHFNLVQFLYATAVGLLLADVAVPSARGTRQTGVASRRGSASATASVSGEEASAELIFVSAEEGTAEDCDGSP